MLLKPVVNNGISTTVPSTGEFSHRISEPAINSGSLACRKWWKNSKCLGLWTIQKRKQEKNFQREKSQPVGGWTNPSEKYDRQMGWFPQIGVKIKTVWNHHLVVINQLPNMWDDSNPRLSLEAWKLQNCPPLPWSTALFFLSAIGGPARHSPPMSFRGSSPCFASLLDLKKRGVRKRWPENGGEVTLSLEKSPRKKGRAPKRNF